MQNKKQQLELVTEQLSGSKLGKEYIKYIVTSLTELLCRVYHAKCWAGRSIGWNQDCQRNINNLRYVGDTILMAESEEDLKSLLMKVKEENEKLA